MTAKSTPKSEKPKTTAPDPKPSKPLRAKTKTVSKRPVTAKAKPQKADSKPAAGAETELPDMAKKELVRRMVEETGMKTGEARRALDASLSVLGGALREGVNVSAAPMGKIRIMRQKRTPNGELVICRIKLKDPKPKEEGAAGSPDDAS